MRLAVPGLPNTNEIGVAIVVEADRSIERVDNRRDVPEPIVIDRQVTLCEAEIYAQEIREVQPIVKVSHFSFS